MTTCMRKWEEQLQMLNHAHNVMDYLSKNDHDYKEAEQRIENTDICLCEN